MFSGSGKKTITKKTLNAKRDDEGYPWHFTFGVQINDGANFFEVFAPEYVEITYREVHGSVPEKTVRRNKLRWKIQGGGLRVIQRL